MSRQFQTAVFEFAEQARRSSRLDDLDQAFRTATEPAGFRWWATLWLRTETPHRQAPHKPIFGQPATEWWNRYMEQRYAEDDPAVREVLKADGPVFEHEVRRREADSGRVSQILSEAEEFGVGQGIACAVRLANGEIWSMGLLGPAFDADPALHPAIMVLSHLYTIRAIALAAPREDLRPDLFRLTPRMREILSMLRHGETQAHIALALGISKRTVEHLMREARERLGVRTVPELIAEAMLTGELRDAPRGEPRYATPPNRESIRS